MGCSLLKISSISSRLLPLLSPRPEDVNSQRTALAWRSTMGLDCPCQSHLLKRHSCVLTLEVLIWPLTKACLTDSLVATLLIPWKCHSAFFVFRILRSVRDEFSLSEASMPSW